MFASLRSLVGFVEMTLEGVEAAGPHGPVWLQPGIELAQRLRPHPINPSLRIDPRFNETNLAQDAQVLRHRRLADVEFLDQLADRPLAVAKQFDDDSPVWLGHDLERGTHRHSLLNIADELYSCQVICGIMAASMCLEFS